MNPGKVREYGDPPFQAALIHGGPGAPGYMAPVARELSGDYGVLEPLQSADSLVRQIDELEQQLARYDLSRLTLIGSSWGAVLGLFLASRGIVEVQRLVLIGSAVFDAVNSRRVEEIRRGRMSKDSRARYDELRNKLAGAEGEERNKLFAAMAALHDDSDFFDPISTDLEVIEVQRDVNHRVWHDFVALRDRPSYLREEFSKINVPVTIIHGDYDPHLLTGIEPFLTSCISDITTHVLPNCGHYPWMERQAKDEFYRLLREVLKTSA